MQTSGARRFLCVSAAGLEVGIGVPLVERVLLAMMVQLLLRDAYIDMMRMEACVRESDIDWTIVRAPRLTNGPRRGGYRMTRNQHLSQWGVRRADLAECILNCVGESTYWRSTIELAYDRHGGASG